MSQYPKAWIELCGTMDRWVSESDRVDYAAESHGGRPAEVAALYILAARLQGWGRRVPTEALTDAVVALLTINGVTAWSGDATSCVAQVIQRAREQVEVPPELGMLAELSDWGHHDCTHCDAVRAFKKRLVVVPD